METKILTKRAFRSRSLRPFPLRPHRFFWRWSGTSSVIARWSGDYDQSRKLAQDSMQFSLSLKSHPETRHKRTISSYHPFHTRSQVFKNFFNRAGSIDNFEAVIIDHYVEFGEEPPLVPDETFVHIFAHMHVHA